MCDPKHIPNEIYGGTYYYIDEHKAHESLTGGTIDGGTHADCHLKFTETETQGASLANIVKGHG